MDPMASKDVCPLNHHGGTHGTQVNPSVLQQQTRQGYVQVVLQPRASRKQRGPSAASPCTWQEGKIGHQRSIANFIRNGHMDEMDRKISFIATGYKHQDHMCQSQHVSSPTVINPQLFLSSSVDFSCQAT